MHEDPGRSQKPLHLKKGIFVDFVERKAHPICHQLTEQARGRRRKDYMMMMLS